MKKNYSSLSYYILEIKWRIFYCLISFIFAFSFSCYFSKTLLLYITDPAIIMKDLSIIFDFLNNLNIVTKQSESDQTLNQYNIENDTLVTNFILFKKEKLIYTDMTEGMLNTFGTCTLFSLSFCSIYFFYQIWAFFISSVLFSEKQKINRYLFFIIFSILNSWFCSFHFILPFSWKFFTSFQLTTENISINCEPRFQSYCFFLYWIVVSSFFLHILLCCIFLLIYYKKITISHFPPIRKIPIFFFLLLSAIISPPDLLSQLIIFIIIWIIFESLYFFTFYIACKIKHY